MDLGVETGAADRPRRPARRPGFLAEMADGIAGAVLSAPALAAAVLFAATLETSDLGLVIGLAHVGGMALSRTHSRTRLTVLCGWIALATLKWAVDSDGWTREFGVADFGGFRIVVALVAAAWGAGNRRAWIFSILVVTAGAAAALALSALRAVAAPPAISAMTDSGLMAFFLFQLGYAVAVFVLLALGRRGWPVAALVVAAVVTLSSIIWAAVSFFSFAGATLPDWYFVWWGLSTICVFAALLVPIVCGMTARAAALGAAPDDGARFVTTLARRPWRTASALGIVLYSGVGLWGAFLPAASFAVLGRIASASALLAMVASGAAGSLGALAPVCVASAFALAAWFLSELVAGSNYGPDVIGHRAVRAAAYVLPQMVARASLARVLDMRRFTMPLVAVAFLVPQIAVSEGIEASPWVGLAWVVIVAAACVAVATGETPATKIVATAVVLGLLQRLGIGRLAGRFPVEITAATSWFELPTAWMLAAVFALIARRARSMTAIPVDHPMFVDFARAA